MAVGSLPELSHQLKKIAITMRQKKNGAQGRNRTNKNDFFANFSQTLGLGIFVRIPFRGMTRNAAAGTGMRVGPIRSTRFAMQRTQKV
jgi:hypothetical protein